MNRMVRPGTGLPYQGGTPSRSRDTGSAFGRKTLRRYIVRAGCQKQEAARRRDGGSEPRKAAIGAGTGLQILARLHEGRWIGHDNIENVVLRAKAL